MEHKSLVFISCGQRKNELEIVQRISKVMSDFGFEPYIAVKQQTLRGVKENIFDKIAEAEYFLFIDFKREKLLQFTNGKLILNNEHRGSLFSHQELAIATFLEESEILAFQENGVKKEDGILGYIQANCIKFSNRNELVGLTRKMIEERNWLPNWKNKILLSREKKSARARYPNGITAQFYFLQCENLHKSKLARNCIACARAGAHSEVITETNGNHSFFSLSRSLSPRSTRSSLFPSQSVFL